MMAEVPAKKVYPLGFHILNDRVVNNNGYVRPANMQELTMWRALKERAVDLTLPVVTE